MSAPLAKKTSSASLGSKLIFLRHQLGRERSSELRQSSASPSSETLDNLSANWTEPSAPRPRRKPKSPALPAEATARIQLPAIISQTQHPHPPTTSLTNPRHTPLTGSVGKKPQSAPHDPRVIGYLVAGGSRVLKPLKHEARVQRNRAIFIAILCVIALLTAWALFAK